LYNLGFSFEDCIFYLPVYVGEMDDTSFSL